MKIAKLLSIAIAALTISTAAQATNIVTITLPGTTTSASTFAPVAANGAGGTEYVLQGLLASNTKIVFDYLASASGIDHLLSGNLASQGQLGLGPLVASSSNGLTQNGVLPVITTAFMFGGFAANGTVTLENLTGAAESFTAMFTTPNLGTNTGTIYTLVSGVPLPPAMILFASGLIALAGFGAYRKNRGQI